MRNISLRFMTIEALIGSSLAITNGSDASLCATYVSDGLSLPAKRDHNQAIYQATGIDGVG